MREEERRGNNSTYTSKVGSLSIGCNSLGAPGDVLSASKARALPECFLKREFNIISVNVYYMIKINKYNIDYLYQQHLLFKNDNKKKTKTPIHVYPAPNEVKNSINIPEGICFCYCYY